MDQSISELSERIRKAAAQKRALRIRGGGTKDFYAYKLEGEPLDVCWLPRRGGLRAERAGHDGARGHTAGGDRAMRSRTAVRCWRASRRTSVPHATLGGCVAAGFSGPRRASAGSVRDFVLGTSRAERRRARMLRFGGQVMKNVAGFDVSRLMTGSFGTLGVILEVSLKVLPRPEEEVTLRFQMDEAQAIDTMNRWAGQPLPISATCYRGRRAHRPLVRQQAGRRCSPHASSAATRCPTGRRSGARCASRRLDAFRGPLWRLSIKSTTPPLALARQRR